MESHGKAMEKSCIMSWNFYKCTEKFCNECEQWVCRKFSLVISFGVLLQPAGTVTTNSGMHSYAVVGKIKSRFDLNRDLRHIVIRFRPQKIRFDCLWLDIWFDLLILEIRFGPKWFEYESRSSPGTAEWLDMPRSIFSKSTASSHASLPPLVICNGEDNLYLMEPVRQDNPAAFWASRYHWQKVTLSYMPSQKI